MTVVESNEETKSDRDDSNDSDFESLFGSMPKDDDFSEDVDFDIERSVSTTRAKAKGKATVSPKRGKSKGVLINKLVSTSTGTRKRNENFGTKGPSPSSKYAKASGPLKE